MMMVAGGHICLAVCKQRIYYVATDKAADITGCVRFGGFPLSEEMERHLHKKIRDSGSVPNSALMIKLHFDFLSSAMDINRYWEVGETRGR